MVQLSMNEAKRDARRGMRRASRILSPSQRHYLRESMITACTTFEDFVVDDLRSALERQCVDIPGEGDVLGPMLRSLAREGVITRLAHKERSTRPVTHGHWRGRWKSNVFQGHPKSPLFEN